jgi:uncharacterized protein (TIGR00297 family)
MVGLLGDRKVRMRRLPCLLLAIIVPCVSAFAPAAAWGRSGVSLPSLDTTSASRPQVPRTPALKMATPTCERFVGTSCSLLRRGKSAVLALPPFGQALVINTAAFGMLGASGKLSKALTPAGTAHAYALALLLYSTMGWRGWGVAVLYLGLGVAVTRVKMQLKEERGIAEGRGGRRGPENVWGSAWVGALCALLSLARPDLKSILHVGFVASFATKLSDTFASEIGKAYGRNTYLITTLRPVSPGTEGAVSMEGTLAGVVGSAFIAAFGYFTGMITKRGVISALIASFVATNIESVLGATLQGSAPWITNEIVNAILILIGAVIGMALYRCPLI